MIYQVFNHILALSERMKHLLDSFESVRAFGLDPAQQPVPQRIHGDHDAPAQRDARQLGPEVT